MKISNGKVVPSQAIESWGNRGTAPRIPDPDARRGEWGSYRPCCFTRDKKSPVFAKQEAGWPAKQARSLWRRQKSLDPTVNGTTTARSSRQ
jgi:hypothetical protein